MSVFIDHTYPNMICNALKSDTKIRVNEPKH